MANLIWCLHRKYYVSRRKGYSDHPSIHPSRPIIISHRWEIGWFDRSPGLDGALILFLHVILGIQTLLIIFFTVRILISWVIFQGKGDISWIPPDAIMLLWLSDITNKVLIHSERDSERHSKNALCAFQITYKLLSITRKIPEEISRRYLLFNN